VFALIGDAGNNYDPAVIRELELVISNQSELEQSAEILLQGKDLPKSSLNKTRFPLESFNCVAE
jgi:hypothetical protein